MINVRKIASAVDVWAALHRRELVEDLKRLIAIRSVAEPGEGGYALGTGCHQAAEAFLELGSRYGFCTENDADYCASILLPGTAGGKELGLLGHLDVVPEGDGWKYDPFCAAEKDGWLIGRGSSDNKGPVVMALYVLRCMRELGYTLKSDLRLIAGFCEETDMRDVRHYLKHHEPPACTLNCDGAWAACIAEKGILTAELVLPLEEETLISLGGGYASNMVPDTACAVLSYAEESALERVRTLYPGMQAEACAEGIRLRVSGKTAHCYMPHQGENAIVTLLNVLQEMGIQSAGRLLQCFTDHYGTGLRIFHEDSLSGKTTCVPSLLHMENGEIRLHINVRYAVTQRSAQLIAAMRKRLARLGIECRILEDSPPRCDAPDQPVVKMLVETCQELLGKQHRPYVMGGGSHSRIFPNSIPYGPGVLEHRHPFGDPHGPDEAVCIDHLLQAMKVYVIALLRLDEMLV